MSKESHSKFYAISNKFWLFVNGWIFSYFCPSIKSKKRKKKKKRNYLKKLVQKTLHRNIA